MALHHEPRFLPRRTSRRLTGSVEITLGPVRGQLVVLRHVPGVPARPGFTTLGQPPPRPGRLRWPISCERSPETSRSTTRLVASLAYCAGGCSRARASRWSAADHLPELAFDGLDAAPQVADAELREVTTPARRTCRAEPRPRVPTRPLVVERASERRSSPALRRRARTRRASGTRHRRGRLGGCAPWTSSPGRRCDGPAMPEELTTSPPGPRTRRTSCERPDMPSDEDGLVRFPVLRSCPRSCRSRPRGPRPPIERPAPSGDELRSAAAAGDRR